MRRLSSILFAAAMACAATDFAGAGRADDIFKYEDIDLPLIGTTIPGVKLAAPGRCGYFAIQYGPRKADVAYILLDFDPGKGRFETLHVYAKGDARYDSALRLRGAHAERRSAQFGAFGLKGVYGGVDAQLDVTITTEGTVVELLAVCTLLENGQRLCRFSLEGPLDVGGGADRPAEVFRLLASPTVSCILDHRSDPPKLSGGLKMGRWTLIPESKMTGKIKATLASDDGDRPVKDDARLDEEDRGRYRFAPRRRMIPGKAYQAEVTADLGEFFGVLTLKKRLIPRKA